MGGGFPIKAFGNDTCPHGGGETCPHGSGEWAVHNVFTGCLQYTIIKIEPLSVHRCV